MVSGAEIMGAYQGLQAAFKLIEGLNATAKQAAINEIKVELTRRILDAQAALLATGEAQAATVHRIAELEQEVVRLKDWSAEKERYQLHSIDRRAFAYVKKPGMEGSEPPHWLCTNCFDNNSLKSILQFIGQMNDSVYRCHCCDASIHVYNSITPGE
jgi:hypothetical protein